MSETIVIYDQRPSVVVTAPGPQGPLGPAGIQMVNHGTNANVVRPNFTVVYWVGTVRPLNALPTDLWYNG